MNYNYRAFFHNGRAPSQSSIYNNPYANNTNNNEGSNSSTYIRMIPIVNNTGSLNNSNMNDSNGKFSAKNASSTSLLNQHRLSMFNYDYQTNNKQPATCSTTETLRRKNSFNSTIGTGVSDKRANTINNSPHFTSNTDLSYGAGSYISLSPKSSMLNSKRFNSIINNINTINNNNNNSANIANQNRKSMNGGSNRTINSMHITNVRNHVNYINNMNSINHQQHQQSPSFFAGNNNNNNNSSNNSHNASNMNIKKKPKSKYDNDNSNDSTESSCSVDESSSIISDMEFDNKSEKKCNFSPPKSRQFQSTPNEMIITNRYSTISNNNNNNNNGKTMNMTLNRKSLANSKEMSDSLLALKDKTNNLKLNNSNNNKENFENHKYTFKPLLNESHQQPTLSFQQHRNQHGVNSYSKSISVSNKPITRRGLASVSTAQNPYQIRIVSNKDLLNSKKYSIISTPTINLANEDMNSLKYSKSTYYKRIDDYSSSDSLNKNNSWIKSLKKSSSLYYDSGIGADVSFIHSSNLSNLSKEPKANYSSNNTINGIYNRKLDKPTSTQAYCTNTNNNLYKPEGSTMSNKYAHNDVQLRPTSHKRYHYSETLNPNLVRKLCSTSNNSNRLALHSSSSSSSSSDKARKTFEAIFRLNNQNNANNTAANANISSNNVSSANNNEKINNTIEISNNNEMNNDNNNSNSCMNSTNKQSIKHNSSNDLGRNSIVGQNQIPTISLNNDNSSNSFFKNENFALARKSSITSLNEMNSNQINGSYNNSYTRADFTPNLTRNAISKTSLIKRKLSMPPPPIINNTFNNMGYVSNNNINGNNNATIGSSATSISAIKISSNSNINNTYPMFKANLYSNNTKQSTQNLNVINNNNNGKTSNNGSTLDLLSNISASKNVQNKFDSISNINYDRENSASNMFPNLNDIYYTSQPVYARNSKSNLKVKFF